MKKETDHMSLCTRFCGRPSPHELPSRMQEKFYKGRRLDDGCRQDQYNTGQSASSLYENGTYQIHQQLPRETRYCFPVMIHYRSSEDFLRANNFETTVHIRAKVFPVNILNNTHPISSCIDCCSF